ncbi:MAG: hypothetical protein WC070_00600 [Candidatus Magasanikbacteria bacterium]
MNGMESSFLKVIPEGKLDDVTFDDLKGVLMKGCEDFFEKYFAEKFFGNNKKTSSQYLDIISEQIHNSEESVPEDLDKNFYLEIKKVMKKVFSIFNIENLQELDKNLLAIESHISETLKIQEFIFTLLSYVEKESEEVREFVRELRAEIERDGIGDMAGMLEGLEDVFGSKGEKKDGEGEVIKLSERRKPTNPETNPNGNGRK